MTSCKTFTFLSCLLSMLLVGCRAHGNLRGAQSQKVITDAANEEARETRRLQPLFAAVVNGLISVATPRISEKLIYIVRKYYNTYDFTWTTNQQFMGEGAFLKKSSDTVQTTLPSLCNPSAGDETTFVTYDYSLQLTQLDGIGDMAIDRIAYVEGSSVIDLQLGIFKNAADWSGKWIVDTSFDNMTANTRTTLTATIMQPFCGNAKEVAQTVVNGTVVFDNIEVTTLATVSGDTERIALFLSTSTLQAMAVDSMSFRYDPINATSIGIFELDDLDNSTAADMIRNLTDLRAVAIWGDTLDYELQQYGEKIFKYTVEDELNYILPRPLLPSEQT